MAAQDDWRFNIACKEMSVSRGCHHRHYIITINNHYWPSPPQSPSPEALLRYCAVWNTNARNCQDAQVVLQVLLTHLPPEELLQYQGARTHLEGLIPYTGQQGVCVCVICTPYEGKHTKT